MCARPACRCAVWHVISPFPCDYTRTQVEGTGPKARSGHSSVSWQDKGILIFGGMNMALETFFDDAWLLTIDAEDGACGAVRCSWSQPAAEGAAAVARNSHTACMIEDGALAGRMVVLGGSDGLGPMVRIQVADLTQLPTIISWSDAQHASHSQMAPREMHAAAALGRARTVCCVDAPHVRLLAFVQTVLEATCVCANSL